MAAPGSLFGKPVRRPPLDPMLRARDERVEALKTVIGKLAHDFNNFLVPQFGYLTLVAEELPAESAAGQYLKTMEGAARTTEAYIESIMLAVRPQRQYAPKEFDLGRLVEETVADWSAELPRETGVRVQAQVSSAPFFGDERHWRKLAEHLLSNARYALATGGRLELELQPREISSEQMQRLGMETCDLYQLRVQDSGFGMAEGVRERAFDPFFTTRALTRGSGLGLTIVHTVTHFHGGQVELESAEDAGTTVTLWVPRQAPATAQSAVSGLLRQKTPRKRKVLLIENDPFLKEVLRGWLISWNFDAHAADNPQEALKTFERDPASWSLIISESHLAEESLFEKAAKVPGLGCILLGEKSGALRISEPGRLVVLAKPLSMRAFSNVVQQYARD